MVVPWRCGDQVNLPVFFLCFFFMCFFFSKHVFCATHFMSFQVTQSYISNTSYFFPHWGGAIHFMCYHLYLRSVLFPSIFFFNVYSREHRYTYVDASEFKQTHHTVHDTTRNFHVHLHVHTHARKHIRTRRNLPASAATSVQTAFMSELESCEVFDS